MAVRYRRWGHTGLMCARAVGVNSRQQWRPSEFVGQRVAFHVGARLREAAPNSPWRVFVDTFKSELNKSKELQESVKALQDSTKEFGESEGYRRAQEAYNRARDAGEQAGGTGTNLIRKFGSAVGSGAAKTWNSGPVKFTRSAAASIANTTSNAVSTATAPIRNTKTYKQVTGSVREVIDDGSSSRYGGYTEREQRKLQREQFEKQQQQKPKKKKIEEDPEAGEGIVLHKDSAWRESWNNYKERSSLFANLNRLAKSYDESENPVVASIRDLQYRVTDSWSNFTAENEQAQVVRIFREMDPNFNLEMFLRELRDYILPEIIDACVVGDAETLKLWLSEAPYSVWHASAKEYISQGLVSAGKVLDIRGVDIHSARLLPPNDIPVFVIAFRTQEVHMYKNGKTGEVVAGREDHIQQVTYAAVITRIESDMTNPETKGWRVVELARARAIDYH